MKNDRFDRDEFSRTVLGIAAMIPAGRATSYGALAHAAGHPNLSRTVGRIMAGGGDGTGIPAHRVVNSNGMLSGRHAFGGSGSMERLLRAEGIEVSNNRIKNWGAVFWDPLTEIDI